MSEKLREIGEAIMGAKIGGVAFYGNCLLQLRLDNNRLLNVHTTEPIDNKPAIDFDIEQFVEENKNE